MADSIDIRREDLSPVYTRVSWGALFAGLFVTLTVVLLLGALGTAIGLSVSDAARGDTLAVGGGVWAVFTALIGFFCGGCVTSRLTAGESRAEAAIYGTILWGVTFAVMLWMTGTVARTGLTAVVGSVNVPANAAAAPGTWEQAAQRAGVPLAQVERMKAELPTAEQARSVSSEAAWWSFAGIAVSLLAAIGGTLAGSGPQPVIGGLLFRRTTLAVGNG